MSSRAVFSVRAAGLSVGRNIAGATTALDRSRAVTTNTCAHAGSSLVEANFGSSISYVIEEPMFCIDQIEEKGTNKRNGS